MILSFAKDVHFFAWKGESDSWMELGNFISAVYADSGSNKSAALSWLRSQHKKAEELIGKDSHITSVTIEALMSFLSDNGGRAVLWSDEAKMFFQMFGQYKKNGDDIQKFMEMLGGVTQKKYRCGGASSGGKAKKQKRGGTGQDEGEGEDEDDEDSPEPTTAAVEVLDPGLYGVLATHPTNVVESFTSQGTDKGTDGRAARIGTIVVNQPAVRLPKDRSVLEAKSLELAGGPQLWVLFLIVDRYNDNLVSRSEGDPEQEGTGTMMCTPAAYGIFQRYTDQVEDALVELRKCLPLAGGQISIMSKSKGMALKMAGSKQLLLVAEEVHGLASAGLHEWRRKLPLDMAAFATIVDPHLDTIIMRDIAKGGLLSAEAMAMGVAEAEFNASSQLACFNNVSPVMDDGSASAASSPDSQGGLSSSSSQSQSQEQLPTPPRDPASDLAQDEHWTKMPPASEFRAVDGVPKSLLHAAALVIFTPKTSAGLVSASYMAEAMKPKTLIGSAGATAYTNEAVKPTFFQAAYVLEQAGLGKIVAETVPASGGKRLMNAPFIGRAGTGKVFFELVDVRHRIDTSPDPPTTRKLYEVKLAVFNNMTVDAYAAYRLKLIDFSALDPAKIHSYKTLQQLLAAPEASRALPAPEASTGEAEGTARLGNTGDFLHDLLDRDQRETTRRANERRIIGEQVEAQMANGIRVNPDLQATYAAGNTGTVTMSQLENGLDDSDDDEEGLALDAAEDAARGAEDEPAQ